MIRDMWIGSISPSPPPELNKDELRVWELQRALQKSEAALAHIKKASSQQQRNRTYVIISFITSHHSNISFACAISLMSCHDRLLVVPISSMVAHKAKLEQLEAKCQSLEFQVLYGDTKKDHVCRYSLLFLYHLSYILS
jgi:hypothetical protein